MSTETTTTSTLPIIPRSTTGELTLKPRAFKPVLRIDTSMGYEGANPNFNHNNTTSYSSNWAVAVVEAQAQIRKRRKEERKKRKWEAAREEGRRTSPKLIQEIDRLYMYEGVSGRGV